MATIHVDGKQYEVSGADNLLEACLSLGLDIPYFCWHPAMGSVGACRQCAVKQYANADDKRGRLVMSCMTQATENMVISIDDAEAVAFRESVVEWLMTNHPHDCPVCEEGGHCHLQDMTVMTGHNMRRYRFSKRTHVNQELGPFINHEMNRCIACYRCVRYYKDYAGGTDFGVYGAHDNVYFGRPESGTLESEFSGNLTEVCPTGVFTDKTHSARYNRKWDMQFAPSICQGCSVGCNVSPGERYGEIRRIENRYNGTVNHYFLCDRGRFGYGFANREDRPRQPVTRDGTVLSGDAALDQAADVLRAARRVIGIASPRASLEANHALRELVGNDNFFLGVSAAELGLLNLSKDILARGVRTPSLREIESFDGVLVLGEDVTQTAPRVALALRQSARNKTVKMAAASNVQPWQAEALANIGQGARSPVYVASFDATRLDDIAAGTFRAAADDIARLGFAVAHAIDAEAPAVSGLDAATATLAQQIAAALLAADAPLVVSGTGAQSATVLEAAANVATALRKKGKSAGLTLCLPEANSLGLALMGGKSLDEALSTLEHGDADAVVVIENDLYRRAPKAKVDAALSRAATMIAIDHQRNATTQQAGFVLPAASFAEGDGTLVNNEGRAQRFFQVYDPVYYKPDIVMHETWRWLHALQTTLQQREIDWTLLDDVTKHCADANPVLAGIVNAAPAADFRIKGLKIARSPRRYSGRTAQRAPISVHEPRTPQDQDSALAFSMEGYSGPNEPSALVPFAWAPGWNSPSAWNKFQDEVGGHLRAGDPGVRLIEGRGELGYFTTVPSAFAASTDLRIVPLYHLFGSEELSSAAPVVQDRVPGAYVALASADATRLGLADGARASVKVGDSHLELTVRVSATQPAGIVGLPVGVSAVPVVAGQGAFVGAAE
ncbi:MAG TPA: NADH-quinone oxidoreductase subunit NuoG [Moraxellaceae bacterium]|nr:NADH-quinone oxidoreductase subunit NuoG [Moraxellaceae bacterium]